MISVRIVNVEYYMSYPIRELDVNYSEFRGTDVRQVPVIQIFGSSQTGQKICVNIHGVFPYIFIPYDGSEPAGSISYKIASELDKALNVSLGQGSSNTVHVHNVILVSGIPFYGYHERHHQFFKIYFYNPAIIKKACSLLENGAILNKCFQPYESHINYVLQFMIDYNLHGMSYVNISQVTYRYNPDAPDLLKEIPRHLILPHDIQRRTVCKYEVDVLASFITNRDEISSDNLAVNPGIAALWEDEKQRRRDKEMDSQISFSLTQDRNDLKSTISHTLFENKLNEKLNGEFKSDESNLDLNKSVYPVETPENFDILNASTVDSSSLDANLQTEISKEVKESNIVEHNDCDKHLLDILKELKEQSHIEEDSILSQEINVLETESSDNEEQNMTLINKDISDDDSVWENSFWTDISSQIPQVDGQYDLDDDKDQSVDSNDDIKSNIFLYRDASKVYIDLNADHIPSESQLQSGINKLIVYPKNSREIPPNCRITILSDIRYKQPTIIQKIKKKPSEYDPLCISDTTSNYDTQYDNIDNEVIINDVCLLEDSDLLQNGENLSINHDIELPCESYNFYENEFDEFLEENEKQEDRNNTKSFLSKYKPEEEDAILENTYCDSSTFEKPQLWDSYEFTNIFKEDSTNNLRNRLPLPSFIDLQKRLSNHLKIKDILSPECDKLANLNLSEINIFEHDSEESLELSSTKNEIIDLTNIVDKYKERNEVKITDDILDSNLVDIELNNNESTEMSKKSSNIDLPETNMDVQMSNEQIHAIHLENLKVKMSHWNLDGQADSSTSDSSCKTEEISKLKKKAYVKHKLQNDVNSRIKTETVRKTPCASTNRRVLRRSNACKTNKESQVQNKSLDKLNDNLKKGIQKELRISLVPIDLIIDIQKGKLNLCSSNVYGKSKNNVNAQQSVPTVLNNEVTSTTSKEINKNDVEESNHKPLHKNSLKPSQHTKIKSMKLCSSSSDESMNEKPKRRYSKRSRLSLRKEFQGKIPQKDNHDISNCSFCDKLSVNNKNNMEVTDKINEVPIPQRVTRSKNNANLDGKVRCRTKIVSKESNFPVNGNVAIHLKELSNRLTKSKSDIREKSPDIIDTISNSSSEPETVQNSNERSKYNTNKIALIKTPIKSIKKNVSPKYSPLNIIRSPRKHKVVESDSEPITKRLRSHVEGIEPLSKSISLNKNETQKKFQGCGALQAIPDLLNKDKSAPKIINKHCDTINKYPISIKKQLFNSDDNLENMPKYEEYKSITYEKRPLKKYSEFEVIDDMNYIKQLKRRQENFFREIEEKSGVKKTNKNCITSSSTYTKLKFTDIEEDVPNSINPNINNDNKNSTSKRIVKKKDKKPVIITESPLIDVETDESNFEMYCDDPLNNLTNEDKDDLILENIEKHYTKIHNLTISELYDLERNFCPEPSTSKIFHSQEDLPNSNMNYSFSYDISLLDDTVLYQSQIIESTCADKNSKIWMPKYFPPSQFDIRNTLSVYNIPEYRYQEPFYSKYSDVTRKVDIGHNVLKISSTSAADYEEFESSIGFCGIVKWRKSKFQEIYLCNENCKNIKITLAGHKKIIMIPAYKPPSKEDVISWIKAKNDAINDSPVFKPEKTRIIIPTSPGNSNDSFNESITISPCSPNIECSGQNIINSSQDTPTSSKNSSTLSQKPKLRKNNLQRKALFSQQKNKNFLGNQSSNDSCQITGVTLNNTHGFQMSFENLQDAKALSEYQYLTILVTELHIQTRGNYYPDPQHDSIRAIFYSILNDVPEDFELPKTETGVIVIDTTPGSPTKQTRPILDGTGIQCKINYVKSETELIYEFIKLVRKWDPDIFVGFEIEMLSWGYLIERSYVIGINLPIYISRINPDIVKNKTQENKTEELKLTGRIILDAWRLFKHEIALQSYTFENLMYHILHQRVAAHSFKNLSFFWEYRSNYYRYITVNYYIKRVEGILKLLDQLDLIGRTSELARLFGIQFYEVLSRGSQFRVESMMLRLAKPLNYIPISPSVQQRAKMRAPEWIPLILEPESRFYTDPLIVLDFQSLYPSIIIAYNYCFATCIGRVENLGSNIPFEFGACQLKISRTCLKNLQGKINFSPCGVGFVKSEVRQGILPRMLKEILETRLMVKASMKENKDNKLLQRVLHNRQLGLKLIANVTYGYTSANFSGRMPCCEIGDSVVSKGRETLERAIRMIEQTEKWRARVVYGDTDSLFVLVPGRSREDAFKIGTEIAEAVTNDNPPPIKLKLEKVYHPSILQTKKRYVGYMYESAEQKEPSYNAKGIETVRRDGCPAVAKMLEKCLRIIFESRDISLVKNYVCRQFEKLLTGRASIQDLIFAREYRGFNGYRPGACVPALELAKKWTSVDKRREPRRGERVPYIIIHGPPGLPLIRLVRSPRDFLDQTQSSSLRPNAIYYITRVIAPPLNRCLTLIGADVHNWFNEMPRKLSLVLPTDIHYEKSKKSTISQYFATMNCVVCNNQTRDGLCEDCVKKPQQSTVILQQKVQQWERSFDEVKQICYSCCGRTEYTDCISLDCPVLYRLNQTKKDGKQVPFLRNLISKISSDF